MSAAYHLTVLAAQLRQVVGSVEFQAWSAQMSGMLAQSPKRELPIVV
jgi:hypothetical protein